MSIAIAGTILVDKINEINAFPKEGELTGIIDTSTAVGGCVPNVAIDCKAICPELTVKAIGKTGKDGDGKFVCDKLSERGIDVSGIKAENGVRTSFSEVMSVKGGQRTFFTYAGASADFGYDDMDFDKLNVKMLHLGYFLLLDKVDGGDGIKILKEAKKRNIVTSIDLVTASDGNYRKVINCLPFTDNLIINESEASGLSGLPTKTAEQTVKAAERLKDAGVNSRVIIHAPEYAVCRSDSGTIVSASYDLPKGYVKGSTGAGDAFCSGCLIGIYQNLSDREILDLAASAAVAVLGAADAVSGIRSKEEILRFTKDLERKRLK